MEFRFIKKNALLRKKIVKSLDISVKKREEKYLKCCKKVLTAFTPYSIMNFVDDVGS